MNRIPYLVPVLIAATAHAGELTLEVKPFSVTQNFPAIVLPDDSMPITLGTKTWSEFRVISLADHGSAVKKDEVLLVFDAEKIDREITDTRQAIATEKLGLAQAELDLATLENTIAEKLARLRRSAADAAEELAHFTEIRRKASEEKAGQSLKRNEQLLASKKEELKQLLKMYEADDITEDTEEIILQQQKDAVEHAEFALRMEMLNHKRTLAVALPREAVSLTQIRDDTALQLEKGKKELPRSIEQKKIEVAGLKISLERKEQALADLGEDRALFEIKAPADGIFYHGAIQNGKWTAGDLIKELRPEGSAPVNKAFATFIPASAKMVAHAFLGQAAAAGLTVGAKGSATLSGRSDIAIPATLTKLGAAPNPDQTYHAILTAEWPPESVPNAGQSMEINLVSHSSDKAIAVPSESLAFGPTGWTVEVRLADGKTEKRPVTKGWSSGGQTEITAGVEAGQVIIVP